MRPAFVMLLLLAATCGARGACLDSDKVELVLAAHDRGESLKSVQRGFFSSADAATKDTVAEVYKSGVKPWDAGDYALKLCHPEQYKDLRIGGDDPQTEKMKEASYRASFNRMPNIPGICVGEACSHIRKIQRWDANGDMIN